MATIPPYLKQGDTIGIVCPSGFMPYQKAMACISVLQQCGYKVIIGKTLGNQHHYFAGTDDERLADLQTMLDDISINAILCGRGGYGLSRIIDQLDLSAFSQNPKWVIGFSDITVLHAHINTQLQIAGLHAPMAAAFNEDGYKNEYVQSLLKALAGTACHYACNPHPHNKTGTMQGELVGGNLSIVAHLIGSKSSYDTNGKILFLEDVGEYLYNIDRLFTQLQRAGMLANLAGAIIGGFTDMKDTVIPFGEDAYTIISHHFKNCKYPVCFDFPVGHQTNNYALKVGAIHKLVVDEAVVRLEEVVE